MLHKQVPRPWALSGALFVILFFVGGTLGGSSPDIGASRAKLADWVSGQAPTVADYVGGYLELLAMLALVVFIAQFWSVLRTAEGEHGPLSATVLAGGLLSAAIKISSFPAAFAALWRAKQGVEPQLAAALLDMNNAAFVLSWAADALMVGAAAILILRTSVLPRWLGWSGAAITLILLASVPVASKAPPLGFLLTILWIVATSVVLARRAESPVRLAALSRAAVAVAD
jgi:hypothetical protein